MHARTLEIYQKCVGHPAKKHKLVYNKKILAKICGEHTNFMKRHREIGDMEKRFAKRQKISEKSQKKIIKSSLNAEKDFKNSLKSSLKILDNKAFLEDAQNHIQENFEDVRIFSNPIFFDKETRKSLTNLGLSMKEIRYYHNLSFNKKDAKLLMKTIDEIGLKKLIKDGKKIADKISAPESIEELRNMQIVSISGSKSKETEKEISGWTKVVVGGILAGIGAATLNPELAAAGAAIAISGIDDLSEVYETKNAKEDEVKAPLLKINSDYPVKDQIQHGTISPTATVSEPKSYTAEYYGNLSSSKREIHRVHCSWLHLIKPSNIHVYNNLADAHSAGLDNCHYCIGGSRR